MNNKKTLVLLIVFVLIIVGALAAYNYLGAGVDADNLAQTQDNSTTQTQGDDEKNETSFAPDFTVTTASGETVKLSDFLGSVDSFTQSYIKNTSIFCYNLIFTKLKEILIKIINKPCLAEHLHSEHYNLVPSFYTAHSRCIIRHGFCHFRIYHIAVYCFIKITQQHWIYCFAHFYQLL